MIRTALAALVLIPTLAAAQPAPALRQDRRELADDRRDAMQAQQLLSRFDAAAARRDKKALGAVEVDVARFLESERREARVEVVSERDRRDRRDDRRDLKRVTEIEKEWSRLRGRADRRSLEQKRALLVELTRLTRSELHEDGREVREDRRDAFEHRR